MQEEINAIIKAAPELLKHGAELVGALKISEIGRAILGPATGEFAERIHDRVRLYRFGRQLELLKKAEKMGAGCRVHTEGCADQIAVSATRRCIARRERRFAYDVGGAPGKCEFVNGMRTCETYLRFHFAKACAGRSRDTQLDAVGGARDSLETSLF